MGQKSDFDKLLLTNISNTIKIEALIKVLSENNIINLDEYSKKEKEMSLDKNYTQKIKDILINSFK